MSSTTHYSVSVQEGLPLWNPAVVYPDDTVMEDLRTVTHVAVEMAREGEYHYLHTTTLAWVGSRLHMCWAAHPHEEINLRDELVRGAYSDDGGLTWSKPEIRAQPGMNGASCYNHSVVFEHGGRLMGLFARWDDEKPSCELFVLPEHGSLMKSTGTVIPGFIPFGVPKKLGNGNWIVSGELFWYEAAMAISNGDDLTDWTVVQVPRPPDIRLMYAEPTLLETGDALAAICRPHGATRAPVAYSQNHGTTWSRLAYSNLPTGCSKPFCVKLSSGQQALLGSNGDRSLLWIAVTRPGGGLFERIWKIRHQQWPRTRLFGGWGGRSQVGAPAQWSYPSAVEKDGNLYVSYTHGKEDACLSIVPVRCLAV